METLEARIAAYKTYIDALEKHQRILEQQILNLERLIETQRQQDSFQQQYVIKLESQLRELSSEFNRLGESFTKLRQEYFGYSKPLHADGNWQTGHLN